MKIDIAALYPINPKKACRVALRRTAAIPERERLDKINALLGLHGTEGIRGDWQNGYWGNIVAAYCNTGDSYGLTVIQIRGGSRYFCSRFFVGTIGDFIEREGGALGII